MKDSDIDELFKRAEVDRTYSLAVDLPNQTISDNKGLKLSFEIAPSRKEVLLKGLDDIGTSLQHVDVIDAYEKIHADRNNVRPGGREELLLKSRAGFARPGEPYCFHFRPAFVLQTAAGILFLAVAVAAGTLPKAKNARDFNSLATLNQLSESSRVGSGDSGAAGGPSNSAARIPTSTSPAPAMDRGPSLSRKTK